MTLDPLDFHTVDYVRYDPATGEILNVGHEGAAHVNRRNENGEHCFPASAVLGLHWFDTEAFEVKAKDESTATLDGFMLRDIPPFSRIYVLDVTGEKCYECGTKTAARLNLAHPGSYRVLVRSARHLDRWFEVEKT